jgi:integrase
MQKPTARNERTKRKYLTYLREARGQSEATLDQVASSIDRFAAYTKNADFANFHVEKVKAFKARLTDETSVRTGRRLSHATLYATLNTLRSFFEWLAGQPGYRQSFAFGDWDYFTPMGATASIAKAYRPSRAPTFPEIRRVVGMMPDKSEIDRRNRAVIAFLAITGARVSALASFRLVHINIERRVVFQDARTVKTKGRKSFETWFFRVGDDLENIVAEWVRLLHEKGWSADDPLFPSTRVALNEDRQFGAEGLERKPWASTGPIRSIIRDAFARAGLNYPNPHSFRQTIAAYGREHCKSLAAMQAWAQNLGHESMTTTFGSYGKVTPDEQARLVRGVGAA